MKTIDNIQKEEHIRRQNIRQAKLVISGPRTRLIEVAPLDEYININERKKKPKKPLDPEINKPRLTFDEEEGRFESSLARSRSKVTEHIWNNFVNGSAFLTLTYKDERINVHKYDESLKHFDLFIKELRKKYPDIKYLAVAEEQKKRAKKYKLDYGPIHYHILVDKRDISEKAVRKMWPHGKVFKEKTYGNPKHIAVYITKYITKDTLVKAGRKSYLRSRNLEKSKIITGMEAVRDYLLNQLRKENFEVIFDTSFRTFIGRIFIRDYYLPDKHLHFEQGSS